MNIKDWSDFWDKIMPVLVPLVGFVLMALKYIFDKHVSPSFFWRRSLGDSRLKQSLFEICQSTRLKTGAKQVLVIYSKNGGGVPDIDSDIYSYVYAESIDDDRQKVRDYWQEHKVSPWYRDMLSKVYEEGFTEFRTESIGDEELKIVTSARAITRTEVHSVSKTKDKFWYVALKYTGNPIDMSREDLYKERETVLRFKQKVAKKLRKPLLHRL